MTRNSDHYIQIKSSSLATYGIYSSHTQRVRKKLLEADNPEKTKYQATYFLKNMTSKNSHENSANRQVAALEFLRLMIPRQPKTRLIYSPNKKMEYIQSKEIVNAKNLSERSFSRFKPQHYGKAANLKGIGELNFFALEILEDANHQLQNFLLDDKGWLYRINGEKIFQEKSMSSELKKYIDQLSSNLNYINEINTSLLKMLILPEIIINKFSRCHNLKEDEKFYANLINKRHNLYYNVIFDEENNFLDFRKYLFSQRALNDVKAFVIHIAEFKIQGQIKLVDRYESQWNAKVFDNFSRIKDEIQKRFSAELDLSQIEESLWGEIIEDEFEEQIQEQFQEDKSIKQIQNAINIALQTLKKWQDRSWFGGKSYRGPSGFFSWVRHSWSGHLIAENLCTEVNSSESLEKIQTAITGFLMSSSTRYHRHSFASFLLDELIKIENSVWSSIKPDSNNKYPQEEIDALFQNQNDVEMISLRGI